MTYKPPSMKPWFRSVDDRKDPVSLVTRSRFGGGSYPLKPFWISSKSTITRWSVKIFTRADCLLHTEGAFID